MKFLLSIIAILFTFISCQTKAPLPEKGVSFALNEHRKSTITDISYQIELDIPAKKSTDIKGELTIAFHLNSLDSALVLDFNADSSYLLKVQIDKEDVPYEFGNEHIVIQSKYLEKGNNQVHIAFTAGNLSLNRSDEYLYTLFVPDRASTCFPLFDQPNLKAVYKLTLKTPQDWEAVSNGALQSKSTENGRSIYKFSATKPISSYLFAFAAGKFFKSSKKVEDWEMTMYYRETDTAKVRRNEEEVFKLHAKSLAWLEKYTGIEYPFGKFDFVLVPSFQYGGMEHPGAVFYNESALFLDENPSVNRLLSRASVIAHESAHMWFGDLVTMDWFNDVWLKEVFANFMAAKIVHPSFPEINHNLRFLLAHYPSAYEIDRTSGTNPILQELGNLKNAGTLYGAIIYQKAPIVMRKLEKMIGEELMQESLREYLKTYSFKNARWDDLIGIIDKNTPQDIAKWSTVWVKTPGMPEYQLSANTDSVSLLQLKDAVGNRIWEQPLVFQKIADQSQPVIFPNSDGAGYGYFQMDSASKTHFVQNYIGKDTVFQNPVFRGAMLVNIWEGLLRNGNPQPGMLITNVLALLEKEENALIIDYLLGNLQTTWWTFLNEDQRKSHQGNVEKKLWDLLNKTKDKGIKTSYFRSFKSLVMNADGLKKLESLWNGKLVIKDLVLSEDDKISLAYELALKSTDGAKTILDEQLKNTKNPDRKARMQFVIPALDPDESKRDAFFKTLKNEKNREKEAWVLDAVSYLNHPLRQRSALKYLRPSLNLLQEIQLTGDIFFPSRWLHAAFAGHSSKESADIAQKFLNENPKYPYFLKNKILQETDMLNRAVMLKK